MKSLVLNHSNLKNEKAAKYFLSNNLIIIGLIGYIFVLLFNGILMHIGLSFHFVEIIRPYLPECFLLLSFLGWILNNKIISYNLLAFVIYFIFVSIFSIANFTIDTLLITLRNVFIPVVMMNLFMTCSGNTIAYEKLRKYTIVLFSLFTIVGTIFSLVQQKNGWAWMGTYFQGYASWGDEGDVRIIWSSWNTLRTLGTTGDAATFGLYNSIAILIFLFMYKGANVIKTILCSLSLISIYNSGNKTAMLIAIFLIFYYIFINVFSKNVKLNKRIFFTIILLIVGVLLVVSSFADSESFLYTMNIRFGVWSDIFTIKNSINIFFPHMLFDFSALGNSGGNTTVWDNSYLFLLFSFGIFGCIIIIFPFIKIIKIFKDNNFFEVILIVLIFSMISTNIFIGRNIGGYLLMLLGIMYSNRKEIVHEK